MALRFSVPLFSMGAIVFMLSSVFGTIEGRVAPVAVDFTFEQSGEGRVSIAGTFDIVRPRCDFLAIDAYLIGASRTASVDVSFGEGAIVRPKGPNAFGPWTLGVRPEQMPRLRIDVLHQCPLRPWQTRTVLSLGSDLQ